MPQFHYEGTTYHYRVWGEQTTGSTMLQSSPLVLLHGFAQSTHTWDEIASAFAQDRLVLAFDFVGHGESDHPEEPEAYQLSYLVDVLEAFIAEFFGQQRVILLGYSMGGRVAASFAVAYPKRLDALILEAAGLGPRSDEERAALSERDTKLVRRLEESTVEEFMDFWEKLPLFTSQKNLDSDVQQKVRSARLANDSHALARTVAGSGQHAMPNIREAVADFPFPVLYVAGSKDKKYVGIARSIESGNTEVAIVKAGHNVHLENPLEFTRCVHRFLDTI